MNLTKVIFVVLAMTISLTTTANQQPNIIFILADDLGAHTLSSDGNPIIETPNLDQLVSDGMKFTRGYANAATCKPSRAAIMSGQYAPRTSIYRVVDRHKMRNKPDLSNKIKFIVPPNATHLAQESVTIAESLKAAGYTTGHFGKWHLEKYKSHLPNTQGFDVSFESHKVHFGAKINVDQTELAKGVYVGDYMTEKALDFISNAVQKKQPFFAYLPYYLIHKPLEAKPNDLAYFTKKLGSDYDKDIVTIAAMTKALDDSVGLVLNKLNELDISDETLVIFTSDNGGYKTKGNILNGALREFKGEVYEGGLRVPYIFRYPGKIKANSISSEMVMGIDIYPTLMSFANTESGQEQLDGTDLMPLLLGQRDSLDKRSLYWFFPKWEGFNKKTKRWKNGWRNVINDGQYKLIQYPDNYTVELFDLKNDPSETKNISKNNPELVQQLLKSLDKWKNDISAHKEIPNSNFSLE